MSSIVDIVIDELLEESIVEARSRFAPRTIVLVKGLKTLYLMNNGFRIYSTTLKEPGRPDRSLLRIAGMRIEDAISELESSGWSVISGLDESIRPSFPFKVLVPRGYLTYTAGGDRKTAEFLWDTEVVVTGSYGGGWYIADNVKGFSVPIFFSSEDVGRQLKVIGEQKDLSSSVFGSEMFESTRTGGVFDRNAFYRKAQEISDWLPSAAVRVARNLERVGRKVDADDLLKNPELLSDQVIGRIRRAISELGFVEYGPIYERAFSRLAKLVDSQMGYGGRLNAAISEK